MSVRELKSRFGLGVSAPELDGREAFENKVYSSGYLLRSGEGR